MLLYFLIFLLAVLHIGQYPIMISSYIFFFSFSQDAIGCLASITDSSITKKILMSLFERFQFVDGEGEFEKLWSHNQELIDKEQDSLNSTEKDVQR